MNYQDAGVDVKKGDQFVKQISHFIKDTYDARVIAGVGGFAALYEIDEDRLLAAGTDGVGTKVKLAQELGIHHSIGQDLVAMCVNDVICTGARPLFFLDYLATGKLDIAIHSEIIRGIALACKSAGCALIGGETAEMPGVYETGVYDLAGFCVGEVSKSEYLKSDLIKPGQQLIGLSSSGFHSNGYSLIRKLVKDNEWDLKKALLTPTRLYGKILSKMLKTHPGLVTGVAHVTGGGFSNIKRMNPNYFFAIKNYPSDSWRTEAMNEIIKRSHLSQEELYKTFNMGIGLVLAVKDLTVAQDYFTSQGEKVFHLGQVDH